MTDPKPLPFDPVAEARRQWVDHGWEEAAEGMAAVTSVMRAQQLYLARVEDVLRPLGLTFARYEVLMLLSFSRRGALPLSRLGARLQVHPASITNAVDRLEAAGLVARERLVGDRRTVLAAIQPAGRALAERATGELNRTVFSQPGLSPAELKRLSALLRKLRAGAGDFVAGPRRERGPDRDLPAT